MQGSAVQLERGRRAYADRSWADASESLREADRQSPLGPEDLELLATAAYMLGRDEDFVSILERAHHGHVDRGENPRAVRCAFWIGINLAIRGEMAGASGWFGRAQRLLDRQEDECVEHGYLLIPMLLQQAAGGDWEAVGATATDAARIAERFDDADLFALAVHEQGHALVRSGSGEEGLALLDEAMVAVVAGELSPIVTGLIYCSVITYCQELYELRRAQEWTAALTRWCDEQPDMVAHTGQCLIHRAEIMQMHGAWPSAINEARLAGKRFARQMDNTLAAHAAYREGEVHRLQGEFAAAEEAYERASRGGWEPQPGLALLRLAQGDANAADAAIRRVMGETTEPLTRAGLLPAYIEIIVAVGDAGEADAACRELEAISREHEIGVLGAIAENARGAVQLALGDAEAALVALRGAWRVWQELRAPYEAARTRVLLALACRAVGDEEAAGLELEAARGVFEELGATPDVARVESLSGGEVASQPHGLTARELEVLRLVAAGDSNKAIAAELVISERTVDRHVSNVFVKLGVSSRAAATAFAYEHRLV